jgi:hypothetical protein
MGKLFYMNTVLYTGLYMHGVLRGYTVGSVLFLLASSVMMKGRRTLAFALFFSLLVLDLSGSCGIGMLRPDAEVIIDQHGKFLTESSSKDGLLGRFTDFIDAGVNFFIVTFNLLARRLWDPRTE